MTNKVYKVELSIKPGQPNTMRQHLSVVIEAPSQLTARSMAEAQYGSHYRILSVFQK
ncbi:MAG: hypothetical protein QXN55_00270 [Candidatus Nitrosotenuis sp.]